MQKPWSKRDGAVLKRIISSGTPYLKTLSNQLTSLLVPLPISLAIQAISFCTKHRTHILLSAAQAITSILRGTFIFQISNWLKFRISNILTRHLKYDLPEKLCRLYSLHTIQSGRVCYQFAPLSVSQTEKVSSYISKTLQNR